MNGPIGATRECVFKNAFRALRTERTSNDFALTLRFFKPQRFLQSVAVRLIGLQGDIRFVDPFFVRRYTEHRILVGDLLHQDYDFHFY